MIILSKTLRLLRLVRLLRLLRFPIFVCTAFCINSWNRAKKRRYLRHRLCSRVKDDKPQGHTAFDWESILHGNAGVLGDYKELAVLTDQIAHYLFEFHADSYFSLGLPPLLWTEARPMCMEFSEHIRSLHHTIDYFYQKH